MNANGPDTLFALQNAALRIRDRRILEDTTWTVSRGEHWVVIGPNGAGKTTLLNSVTGQIPVVGGSVYRRRRLRVGLVGPELYRRYLQDEARRQVLWSPVTDSYPVTTARMVIEHRRPGDSYRPDISASGRGSRADPEWIGFLAAGLGVSHLLDRPVGTLSTGEMRKVLLISAMAGSPDLLLLDEPFDGLDLASREWFADAVSEVIGTNTTLILATHREDEIVAAISRYAELSDGRMVRQGPVDRSG